MTIRTKFETPLSFMDFHVSVYSSRFYGEGCIPPQHSWAVQWLL